MQIVDNRSHETRIASVIVVPVGEPIYSEMATVISIVDGPAGEIIEVSQDGRLDLGKIIIYPQEWTALRRAIDRMIRRCRSQDA